MNDTTPVDTERIVIKPPLLPFFFRRLTEAVAIMLISSIPVYLLAKTGYIPSWLPFEFVYVVLFTISAIVFLCLSTPSLREYLIAVDDVKTYFITNLIILGMQGILCIAGLLWFSDDLYTALFGYTKPLRILFVDILWSRAWSAAVFWFVHFVQIIIIPIIRARVKKEYDEFTNMMMKQNYEQDSEEFEEFEF